MVVLICLFSMEVSVVMQTSGAFGAKYRQIVSYEVRPGVAMTPQYTANGQICEMLLERRSATSAGFMLGYSFSEKEVSELLDELVPDAQRGKRFEDGPIVEAGGGIITSVYTYENIRVSVLGLADPPPSGGDKVIVISWPSRKCSKQ